MSIAVVPTTGPFFDLLRNAAPAPPPVRYVPVPLVRQRLEAAGQWEAVAAVLMQNPAAMLRVLTLEQGIDPANEEAREMLTAAGADPDVILAP
jgi:hypothetical protein